jgi:hypothetical protein
LFLWIGRSSSPGLKLTRGTRGNLLPVPQRFALVPQENACFFSYLYHVFALVPFSNCLEIAALAKS